MVYMLLGPGFEETEAIAPLDLLRRAGVEVKTVGLNGKIIYGSHRIGVETDMEINQLDAADAEMVIIPGGLGGVASIRACEKAMQTLRSAWEAGKFVAAICAGPDRGHTAQTTGDDDHFRIGQIHLTDFNVSFNADAVTAIDDFTVQTNRLYGNTCSTEQIQRGNSFGFFETGTKQHINHNQSSRQPSTWR